MPLVRINLLEGQPESYREKLGDAVHRALVETLDVSESDRFQLITEHPATNFRYAAEAFGTRRTSRLVVISITLNKGRTPEMKETFFHRAVDLLEKEVGLSREDIFIGLVDVDPANWFVV